MLPGNEIAPGLRLIETTRLCGAFDRREAMIPTSDVLFFDTETSGLAGGTGTGAFMIGTAHWRGEGLDHIDLLYPARRGYRGGWENCRLATIQRQVLGVVREDDLPGSEAPAPAAWLGYLRGGSARNLRRVADHNRQDLASLAGLLPHLAEANAV